MFVKHFAPNHMLALITYISKPMFNNRSNSVKYSQNFMKSITDTRMHAQTGPNQYAPSTSSKLGKQPIMILSFQTDRNWQTVQIQIRLFLLYDEYSKFLVGPNFYDFYGTCNIFLQMTSLVLRTAIAPEAARITFSSYL